MPNLESEKIENTTQAPFVEEVAKYFMDFLETDFKKRRIPKRNTVQKTKNGYEVGFDLEKYPQLKIELMKLLNSGFSEDTLIIKKGGYTTSASDSPELIEEIEALTEKGLEDVFNEIEDVLKKEVALPAQEYDRFLEEAKEHTSRIFIESPFLEGLYTLITLADENNKIDISDCLLSVFEDRYAEVFRSFFDDQKEFNLSEALSNVVALPEIKDRLLKYFENLAISDAFVDLSKIYRNKQFMDKTDIYLYFYEIKLGNEKFPIIYLPIAIEKENNEFRLRFDKRIFINIKAIDFVVQEFNKKRERDGTLAGKFDRIIYLNDREGFKPKIEGMIREIEDFFELSGNIDVSNSAPQKLDNSVKFDNSITSLSNKFYFFLFDKSDESLINDYEEILKDESGLLEDFTHLLNGFIKDNPKSFIQEVYGEWQNKNIPEKLAIQSPIPLNDEQKQVLIALQKPDCKFLIIEGPPGTGKSHTITAIICRALLEEKSVLVLSDKKEALDVVENKISQTLDKVRHKDDSQNPILRLGKSGNTFSQLMNAQTIARIRENCQEYENQKDKHAKSKEEILEKIKSNLEENISFFEKIKMEDIDFYLSNIKVKENFLDDYFEKDDYGIKELQGTTKFFSVIKNTWKYLQWRSIRKKLEDNFQNPPEDSFFESIHELERLVTAEMRHFLDQRIIDYVDNNARDANNLRTIIRKKRKFPRGLFQNLKKAFPCILAGIRDYAEFIPLEKNLFDLIIIDEASQVSIAQALPALIRGKKIIILGDDKQFSNVKSNNASTVQNREYKNRIQRIFAEEIIKGEDEEGLLYQIEDNFDIKNSILKFVRFIRNYDCLLKKHFRCYPEIISYSNSFFYKEELQCMKIRGKKAVKDVIKFDIIEHDGRLDRLYRTKNTNELEADFIVDKLKEFMDKGIKQSIGIITPHTNQVSMLWDKISAIPERDWLFKECELKIMTFDTCQGEERDYIFYSMVATREEDRLNYIFPRNLSSIQEEENGTIKSQRLNVGFSRAKECIHFVLSKTIEEFSGELKNALKHYHDELEKGEREIIGGTDPNSPMERKVQHYYHQTEFYENNKVPLIPQFELGKYLKQLNRNYQHPAYKVDFLLIYGDQKIVIEYDGFKEHFVNRHEVNEANYGSYMREEDIYRQKVLEGYGYKFLRINRFNIGNDPIERLNERLQALVQQ